MDLMHYHDNVCVEWHKTESRNGTLALMFLSPLLL